VTPVVSGRAEVMCLVGSCGRDGSDRCVCVASVFLSWAEFEPMRGGRRGSKARSVVQGS